MQIKARIRGGYNIRWLIVAVVLLGYCGAYGTYDGLYAFPKDNRQAAALESFKADVGPPSQNRKAWQQYVATADVDLPQDWNAVPAEHGPTDMYYNYALMILGWPLGVFFLAFYLRNLWLWLTADEEGLHTNRKFASWSSLTQLDRSRWQRKGIAIVHFDSDGRSDQIVLDDWKYQPQPVRKIVQLIEQQLGLEAMAPTLQGARQAQQAGASTAASDGEPSSDDEQANALQPEQSAKATSSRDA